MIYTLNTENHDSPELLTQAELDMDMKFFEQLKEEVEFVIKMYKKEMTQDEQY